MWSKIENHPVLGNYVVIPGGEITVTAIALFKSDKSKIMVGQRDDDYIFMRTEGGMNWYSISSVPIEIIQELC